MNILAQFFDDTVTDDDLWNIATEVFIALLIGMLLSIAVYLGVCFL